MAQGAEQDLEKPQKAKNTRGIFPFLRAAKWWKMSKMTIFAKIHLQLSQDCPPHPTADIVREPGPPATTSSQCTLPGSPWVRLCAAGTARARPRGILVISFEIRRCGLTGGKSSQLGQGGPLHLTTDIVRQPRFYPWHPLQLLCRWFYRMRSTCPSTGPRRPSDPRK